MNLTTLPSFEFQGEKIFYKGSLSSEKVILIIGRSNSQKNSIPLERLLNKLTSEGYLIVWPSSRDESIALFLVQRTEPVVRWLDRVFGAHESVVKQSARKLIKGLTLLGYPTKWDYFFKIKNRRWLTGLRISKS